MSRSVNVVSGEPEEGLFCDCCYREIYEDNGYYELKKTTEGGKTKDICVQCVRVMFSECSI